MKSAMMVIGMAIVLNGCTPWPLPISDGENGRHGAESAKEYCKRLSEAAETNGTTDLTFGIILGLLAGAGFLIGAAMGPDVESGVNWAKKNRNTLILGAGALLAVPAAILLARSRDANAASATAGRAMGIDDSRAAMKVCLDARNELVEARSALADLARQLGKPPGEGDATGNHQSRTGTEPKTKDTGNAPPAAGAKDAQPTPPPAAP